ncbi:hypothetical protein PR048_002431 [Dryococelus australis]|uniref:Uncharacterized protein n=1 Tax=Dryococelus australis TaxID=614101 RepID=A0ABQ9ILM9_9NEOP|nr:hypothetical protein PR048_002431 [Dryococelus australis]
MIWQNSNPPELCNLTAQQVKILHRNVIEDIVSTGCVWWNQFPYSAYHTFHLSTPSNFSDRGFPTSLRAVAMDNGEEGTAP